MSLKHDPNLSDPDGLYAALIEAHNNLDEAESLALSSRLVLLLANHIGDPAVVLEAIGVARRSMGRAAS